MDPNQGLSQADRTLSKVASIFGIITFVSTTLGGLTIFYSIYKAYEAAQEELLATAKAAADHGKDLITDLEAMKAILNDLPRNDSRTRDVVDLVSQARQLVENVELQIGKTTKHKQGFWKMTEIYRLGQSDSLKQSMSQLDRMGRQLESRKTNLILGRLSAERATLDSAGSQNQ